MILRHLNDVLSHVEGRLDFRVHRAPEYTSVDYTYAGPDTFDDPVRRECRGLKFHPDGRLMARPLHKFFNVGERPETRADAIDWARPHRVTEKLDGSMIHPALLPDGTLRLMTRAGITDVSRACEERWLERSRVPCLTVLHMGYTPIFEWTSPANRIVLHYPTDRLVLLAVRHNVTGRYDKFDLPCYSKIVGFERPRVLATDAYGDWAGLAAHVGDLEDAEGYVVWFDDGDVVKVKAPWYVTRHRALDGLRFEHRVVRLILDDGTDDVLPLLGAADRDRLARYEHRLRGWLQDLVLCVGNLVARRRGQDRKEFALGTVATAKTELRPVLWRVYDGGDPAEELIKRVMSYTTNGPRLAELFENLGGPRWSSLT